MTALAQMGTLSAVLVAALLSLLLTGLATWYARSANLLDHPGERHSHRRATPRGGGAGLVAALLIASWFLAGTPADPAWLHCIMPATVVIAVLGAWDDHCSLGVGPRLFIQLAVSVGVVWYASVAGWIQGVIAMMAGGLFLVWMTNLYNFMDGSNGMAALQGLFGGLVLAFLFSAAGDPYFSGLSLMLAACCAGFLPWNLGNARVFMGDVGSLSLGFVFASLLLYGAGSGAFGTPLALLVMLLFLTDSTLTLMARVIRGERWYNPHRQHLYQRLIAHGWAHGSVALLYQAVNLLLVLPAIVVAIKYPWLAWASALASMFACVLGWFLLVRRYDVPAQAE